MHETTRHAFGLSSASDSEEFQKQARTLFEGKRGPQPVAPHSAPDRLYGEIGCLKMELDWLKKKSGISLP